MKFDPGISLTQARSSTVSTNLLISCTEVEVDFSLILLVTLGLGVYSASNRNEYQKHKNVSGE
jgi:hypothetical protein